VKASDRINPFINRQPLKTGGRDPFMERVRKALGRTETTPPAQPPPAHDDSVRQVPASTPRDQLLSRFMERAKANTMIVHKTLGDPPSVAASLNACLANHQVTRSILNARDLETPLALANYLAARAIQILPWGATNCRDEAFACEASITDCRYALADSGSLLVWSDETFGRSSTLVVPVHIVLVPASRIVPDMVDALALSLADAKKQSDARLPSNIVIINGPSKTADIEMNLVTGVHGPKFLYVIVLENL
jgi:L-lactate utilization protein LutC